MMENRLAKCEKCHRLFFDWYMPRTEDATCVVVPSGQGRCQCRARWQFVPFLKKVAKSEMPPQWSSQ